VPPESPRIAELRRRVEADPSSIAFAQLAEEYRRAGNHEAAEQCCRTGLTRHPGYLSARVTLGRTLIELNKLDEAEQELDFVLKSAPDNLSAIRGMAEIHQRRGHLESSLDYYRRALPLARQDPEIEENVRRLRRDLAAASPEKVSSGLSFKEAQEEFLAAIDRLPPAPPLPAPVPEAPIAAASPALQPEPEPAPEPPPAPEPVIEAPAPVAEVPAPTRDVEPPIDFDNLLKSLGVPNHQPPPVVDALIDDITTSAPAASAAPLAPPAPEQEILDELEAWLAAIRR
jgi:tetratricopeptide (TPR) repeat protein